MKKSGNALFFKEKYKEGSALNKAKICAFVLATFTACESQKKDVPQSQEIVPETKGITVKLLSIVDLGPEIKGMEGRQLRTRMVTFEPGSVFGPLHNHIDRPGTVYILEGIITDHRNGIATDYGPGIGWPEDRNTTHWLENKGAVKAVEISVDIIKKE